MSEWERETYEREDQLRGTGRTTRMLKKAVADAQSGKRVGIYAYSYAYASQLCVQAVSMGAPKGSVVPLTRQSDRSNLMAVDVVWHDHYEGTS